MCFGSRAAVEGLQAATGEPPAILLMAGGATRSPLWLQMHADVCNLPKAPKQGGAAAYSGEYGAVIFGTNRGDGSIQDAARGRQQKRR